MESSIRGVIERQGSASPASTQPLYDPVGGQRASRANTKEHLDAPKGRQLCTITLQPADCMALALLARMDL